MHTGNEYNYMVGNAPEAYQYNENGSLTMDLRKNITVIGYNHLNLPTFVCDTSEKQNYIINLYDVVGLKLRKRILENGILRTQYDYISGNVYKDNELEFVPTGEGRVIFENHKAVYEYHYKDHLGNLRIAFREAQSQSWRVGAELSDQATEQTQFANVNQTRADKPQSLNEKSCLTLPQKPLGWWKSVSVQKGDVIYARCEAYFERVPQVQNTGINWNLFLFANPNYGQSNGENMLNPNNNLVGIGILPTFANNTASIPKAYLIAQFYNETNQPTHQKILYVTQNNQSWNTLGEIQEIALENGRVEIFVANESNTKVYFDNLSIYKSPTPIVQENHYYPFGMNLVGIEKEGTPNHRFQYNGKEKETSFGLNWLEYGMRDYDAQIGRFHKIDRFSEKYYDLNPYHYGGNNPVLNIDVNGDSIYVVNAKGKAELLNEKNGKRFGINALMKTKDGKALIDKYKKNGKKDIYLMAYTNDESNAKTRNNLSKDKKDGKFNMASASKMFKGFNGVEIKNKSSEHSLIAYSNKMLDESDEYENAESTYHEIYAHIDKGRKGGLYDGDYEHMDYGVEGSAKEAILTDDKFKVLGLNNRNPDGTTNRIGYMLKGSPAHQILQQLESVRQTDIKNTESLQKINNTQQRIITPQQSRSHLFIVPGLGTITPPR